MLNMGVGQGSSVRHRVLERIAQYVVRSKPLQKIRVLEVGSYEGESALVWSHAVARSGAQGSILCVDPWSRYHSAEEIASGGPYAAMDADLGSGAVFDRFLSNIRHCSPEVPINFRQGTLGGLASALASEREIPFDLIYVDGDHRYSAVYSDLNYAIQWVAEGGVICGDDLERFDRVAIERAAILPDVDYVEGYHPGVTRAVYEAFGMEVWREAGVWAVQKVSSHGFRPLLGVV